MSNTNTGGPAFPAHHFDMTEGEHGMTLRDYFAAKAMQGICAGVFPIVKEEDPLPTVARAAYAQADAMLKAREA
jgi:hypothetical protein